MTSCIINSTFDPKGNKQVPMYLIAQFKPRPGSLLELFLSELWTVI